jgi:hypothetical protein
MKSRLYRLLSPALAALLLAASPTPAASAAPTPRDETREKSAASALVRSKAVGSWRCGKFRRVGPGVASRWCVRFSKIAPRVNQDGQNLLHNNFRTTKQFHCSMSKSTTISWNVQGTVEAEAGVIFAKAKTSVTAGVTHSTTTTDEVGAAFKIRGKRWAYCARGHAYFRVVGKTRRQLCGEPGCVYSAGTRFSTRLPASPFFEVGPGKNIDWAQFLPDK